MHKAQIKSHRSGRVSLPADRTVIHWHGEVCACSHHDFSLDSEVEAEADLRAFVVVNLGADRFLFEINQIIQVVISLMIDHVVVDYFGTEDIS